MFRLSYFHYLFWLQLTGDYASWLGTELDYFSALIFAKVFKLGLLI